VEEATETRKSRESLHAELSKNAFIKFFLPKKPERKSSETQSKPTSQIHNTKATIKTSKLKHSRDIPVLSRSCRKHKKPQTNWYHEKGTNGTHQGR
jgi:hypothetical protein